MDMKGESFTLVDGRTVQILPFDLDGAERVEESMRHLADENSVVRFQAMRGLVYEVLARSMPTQWWRRGRVTPKNVGRLVDLGSFAQFLDVVGRVNGWKKRQPGEAPSPQTTAQSVG